MSWLIHQNGRTTRLDARSIKQNLAAGRLTRDAMFWDPDSATWQSIQIIHLRQDKTSGPVVLFVLSLAVAALTVLHLIIGYDIQHQLQRKLGASVAVIFTTLFTMVAATGGAFLVAKLWDHPSRRNGTGTTGVMFIGAALLLTFETIISVSNIVQVPDVVRLLAAIANHENARFISEGEGVIKITGPLGPRLVDDFKAMERAHGPIKLVKLSSPGGLVEPALELAAHFEAGRLPILVDGDCSSACLLLAVASPRSFAVENATFGFHRVYPAVETGSETVEFSLKETWVSYRDYLEKRGVPSEVLDEAYKHGATSVYPVSARQMKDYGAIAGVIPNYKNLTKGKRIDFRYP